MHGEIEKEPEHRLGERVDTESQEGRPHLEMNGPESNDNCSMPNQNIIVIKPEPVETNSQEYTASDIGAQENSVHGICTQEVSSARANVNEVITPEPANPAVHGFSAQEDSLQRVTAIPPTEIVKLEIDVDNAQDVSVLVPNVQDISAREVGQFLNDGDDAVKKTDIKVEEDIFSQETKLGSDMDKNRDQSEYDGSCKHHVEVMQHVPMEMDKKLPLIRQEPHELKIQNAVSLKNFEIASVSLLDNKVEKGVLPTGNRPVIKVLKIPQTELQEAVKGRPFKVKWNICRETPGKGDMNMFRPITVNSSVIGKSNVAPTMQPFRPIRMVKIPNASHVPQLNQEYPYLGNLSDSIFRFQCINCLDYFDTLQNINSHMVTCSQKASSQIKTKPHSQNKTAHFLHQCEGCGKHFVSSLALKSHITSGCANQGKFAKFPIHLNNAIHITDEFCCLKCTQKFQRKEELDSHMVTCYQKASSQNTTTPHFWHKCLQGCGKHFVSQLALKMHISSGCTNQPKVINLPNHLNYATHITHGFCCLKCTQKFKSLDELQSHITMGCAKVPLHTQVQVYTDSSGSYRRYLDGIYCNKCTQKFDSKDELVKHAASCTFYRCNFVGCYAGFSDRIMLEKHESIHDSIQCMRCEKRFGTFADMEKHVQESCPGNQSHESLGVNCGSIDKPSDDNKCSVDKPSDDNQYSDGKPSDNNMYSVDKPIDGNKYSVDKLSDDNKYSVDKPIDDNKYSNDKPSNDNHGSVQNRDDKYGAKILSWCTQCDKHFMTFPDMNRHVQECQGNASHKPHVDNHCGVVKPSDDNIYSDDNKDIGDKPNDVKHNVNRPPSDNKGTDNQSSDIPHRFGCLGCPQVFKSKDEFLNHAAGCMFYRCKFVGCSARFADKFGLEQHERGHYAMNITDIAHRFSCLQCTQKFKSNIELLNHMAGCTFCCCKFSGCHARFADKFGLEQHERAMGHYVMNITDILCCLKCTKKFQSKDELENHVAGCTYYRCKFPGCYGGFPDKIRLEQHALCHKIQCAKCNRCFMSSADMRQHVKECAGYQSRQHHVDKPGDKPGSVGKDSGVDKPGSVGTDSGVNKPGSVGKDSGVDKPGSFGKDSGVNKPGSVGKDSGVDKPGSVGKDSGVNNPCSANKNSGVDNNYSVGKDSGFNKPSSDNEGSGNKHGDEKQSSISTRNYASLDKHGKIKIRLAHKCNGCSRIFSHIEGIKKHQKVSMCPFCLKCVEPSQLPKHLDNVHSRDIWAMGGVTSSMKAKAFSSEHIRVEKIKYKKAELYAKYATKQNIENPDEQVQIKVKQKMLYTPHKHVEHANEHNIENSNGEIKEDNIVLENKPAIEHTIDDIGELIKEDEIKNPCENIWMGPDLSNVTVITPIKEEAELDIEPGTLQIIPQGI